MRIIRRHILAEFLKVLAVTAASLTALFLVIEVVETADDLIEYGAPLSVGLRYFACKLPGIFFQTCPMAVLLATLVSLGILNRQGEITAIKAAGVGLAGALAPLFVAGAVVSVLALGVNETVAPASERAAESIEARWLGRGAERIHMGRMGFWLRSGDTIYNIMEIDAEEGTLRGVDVYTLDIPPFALASRVSAPSAHAEGGRWKAEKAVVRSFGPAGVELGEVRGYEITDLGGPDELTDAGSGYERMGFFELSDYAESLEREGYDTSRYTTELYSRISFPLVNLVMVLVGIPFALRAGRHGGIAAGVGLSVVIGFGYWIVFGMAKSLGSSGILPPLVAAAFPDALFLALGALMFGYVRQ